MGGIGSGGARATAGRKRKPSRRLPSGRLAQVKASLCGCGQPKNAASERCMPCSRLASRRLGLRECAICQKEFRPRVSKSKCCGPECGREFVRRVNEERTALSLATEAQKLRRRRGCTARRERGAKNQTGRWWRICERDGWVCWICGEAIFPWVKELSRRPSCDHVVPLVCGGSDEDENLRPAHFGCNSRRGAGREIGLCQAQQTAAAGIRNRPSATS